MPWVLCPIISHVQMYTKPSTDELTYRSGCQKGLVFHELNLKRAVGNSD